MGFFKKIFGDLAKTNVGDQGSYPSTRRQEPRYPKPLPPGEWDELADAEATMDEAKAADILKDLDTEEGRLFAGQWIETPQSSNVKSFRWDAESESIEISFKDGSFYRVDPINRQEAVDFLHSASKGGWYWDNVRIRGTKLGHKKNYVYLSGPSGNNRKWYKAGAEASAAHGREADRQSGVAYQKGGFGRKRGKRQ